MWRLIALGMLFAAGASIGHAASTPEVVTVTDTITAARYAEATREWRITEDGLRARLEGVTELEPERIVVVEVAPAPPPERVPHFITLRGGELITEWLVDRGGSLYSPEISTTRVTNCDEGLQIGPTGVICDPARLGHLWLEAKLTTLSASPAVSWASSYRSRWEFTAGFDFRLDDAPRRFYVGATVRLQLF